MFTDLAVNARGDGDFTEDILDFKIPRPLADRSHQVSLASLGQDMLRLGRIEVSPPAERIVLLSESNSAFAILDSGSLNNNRFESFSVVNRDVYDLILDSERQKLVILGPWLLENTSGFKYEQAKPSTFKYRISSLEQIDLNNPLRDDLALQLRSQRTFIDLPFIEPRIANVSGHSLVLGELVNDLLFIFPIDEPSGETKPKSAIPIDAYGITQIQTTENPNLVFVSASDRGSIMVYDLKSRERIGRGLAPSLNFRSNSPLKFSVSQRNGSLAIVSETNGGIFILFDFVQEKMQFEWFSTAQLANTLGTINVSKSISNERRGEFGLEGNQFLLDSNPGGNLFAVSSELTNKVAVYGRVGRTLELLNVIEFSKNYRVRDIKIWGDTKKMFVIFDQSPTMMIVDEIDVWTEETAFRAGAVNERIAQRILAHYSRDWPPENRLDIIDGYFRDKSMEVARELIKREIKITDLEELDANQPKERKKVVDAIINWWLEEDTGKNNVSSD